MANLSILKKIPDNEIQHWLQKVDSESKINALAVAFLGCDDETKKCIFRNMSEKAGSELTELVEKNKKMNIEEEIIGIYSDMLEQLI